LAFREQGKKKIIKIAKKTKNQSPIESIKIKIVQKSEKYSLERAKQTK